MAKSLSSVPSHFRPFVSIIQFTSPVLASGNFTPFGRTFSQADILPPANRKSGVPRAKQKNTQCEVAKNVSGLAEEGVPHRKLRRIYFEHKMKDRIQNPSGVFGRAEVRGFDGDSFGLMMRLSRKI